MNENCKDLVQDGVVRIDFYLNAYLGILIPPTVAMLTQVAANMSVQPQLSLTSDRFTYEAAKDMADRFVELDNGVKVTLKSSSARSAVGVVYSYDLQIQGITDIDTSISEAIKAEQELNNQDYSVVLRYADGSRKLIYLLPNTPTLSVEQNSSNDDTQANMKLAGKSMSNLIDIG